MGCCFLCVIPPPWPLEFTVFAMLKYEFCTLVYQLCYIVTVFRAFITSLRTMEWLIHCSQQQENSNATSYSKSSHFIPLRRTIYTALLAFAPVFERNPGLKIIALPDLQEVSDLPCDCGSDLETLKKEVIENNLPVDLSLIPSE